MVFRNGIRHQDPEQAKQCSHLFVGSQLKFCANFFHAVVGMHVCRTQCHYRERQSPAGSPAGSRGAIRSHNKRLGEELAWLLGKSYKTLPP